MALALGAPPDTATAKKVAKSLVDDVTGFGNRTTTGVVGIAWLFPALDEYGYGEEALAVLLNDAYPSIGHMAHQVGHHRHCLSLAIALHIFAETVPLLAVVLQNMTTLCENLACTFHEAGGGSQNHIMLGGFDAWLTSSVGGLDSMINGTVAGWRHIKARVSPGVLSALKKSSFVKHTRFGDVKMSWTFDGSSLKTDLTLPVGTEAAFHTPSSLRSEGGKRLVSLAEGDATDSDHETLMWTVAEPGALHTSPWALENSAESHAVIATVGSGRYHFVARYE